MLTLAAKLASSSTSFYFCWLSTSKAAVWLSADSILSDGDSCRMSKTCPSPAAFYDPLASLLPNLESSFSFAEKGLSLDLSTV